MPPMYTSTWPPAALPSDEISIMTVLYSPPPK
jgi:hypothetical protein